MACRKLLAGSVHDRRPIVIFQFGDGSAADDLGAALRGGVEQELIQSKSRQARAAKRQWEFCTVSAKFEAEMGNLCGAHFPDVNAELCEQFLSFGAEELAAYFMMGPSVFSSTTVRLWRASSIAKAEPARPPPMITDAASLMGVSFRAAAIGYATCSIKLTELRALSAGRRVSGRRKVDV